MEPPEDILEATAGGSGEPREAMEPPVVVVPLPEVE
jgi:hypothetical protein